MLALRGEHHAGMPGRMMPLSGHPSEVPGCGQVVREPRDPLHPTSGSTYLVADRARYRAENLQKLAHTQGQGRPRVPATWSEAQAVRAQAEPEAMMPLTEG
jgi:hypothetical protein